MLVGVSTRKYARSLEPLPDDLDAFGTSKSAVSRRFVKQTTAQVEEFLQRRLDSHKLCVLMLDGVHVVEHVLLVAVGIDKQGNKHVLGMREGAPENAVSCRELLCDLREREMHTERSLLVVLDGSNALIKAVREVFGERALIQRCRVHKERTVTEQIPKELVSSLRHTMQQAYASRDAVRTTKQLENLAHSLEVEHPGAAESLHEGLQETLTVMRLSLPDELVRHLSSTNLIENLIGSVRTLSARGQNWRDVQMPLRRICATAMDAAKRFRTRYQRIPKSPRTHYTPP
jgi:transposase-like protein